MRGQAWSGVVSGAVSLVGLLLASNHQSKHTDKHPCACRYSIFAEELTQRPIAECAAAFAEADAWFSAWQGGDVQPDEMLIIADQVPMHVYSALHSDVMHAAINLVLALECRYHSSAVLHRSAADALPNWRMTELI